MAEPSKYPELFSAEIFDRETDEYIKEGLPFPELLINTTYLFDKWISATLPYLIDDPKFLLDGDIILTEEQRFYFYLGCSGFILEKESGCRIFFNIVRQAYRLKSLVNRVSEAELMKECWKLASKLSASTEKLAQMINDTEERRDLEAIVEKLKEGITIAYPPKNDAEAVEFVRCYFMMAICFCCGCIRGYVEDDEVGQ